MSGGSTEAGPSSSNVRSRRRKDKDGSSKRKRAKFSNPETGGNEEKPSGDTVEATFGEDFIGFSPSDNDEPASGSAVDLLKSAREWDIGKSDRRDSRSVRGRDRDRDRDRRRRGHDRDDDGGKRHSSSSSRRAPWVDDVDWEECTTIADMLHKEVSAYVEYIQPTDTEHKVRGMIIALIEKIVTQRYPDAKVLPFGSFETRLYLPMGDIDLVVQSDSMAHSDKVNVLQHLANTLRKSQITDKVTIIAKAKVPIIKFVTRHGHFAVDISINQLNGVSAGRMVNNFIGALPALRALVLIVKSFLSQRSMNEVFTGGLGSYSVVCLAVSFLQQHPKIRRGEMDPMRNLGVLVLEFFEFYGLHFNYQDVGISIRDGGTYYNKNRRGWADYKQPGLLSIEDPADTSNDISRGSYGIVRVRQTLAGAYEIMMASAYQRADTLRARRSGRYTSLRDGRTTNEEWSVLASVMGVTQETVNHRRVVQEVWEDRVLHKLLGIEDIPATPSKSKEYAQETGVAGVWEADETASDSSGSSSDDSDTSQRSKKRKRIPTQTTDHRDEEEEEESRYRIKKDAKAGGPPRKRRRVGAEVDAHPNATTEEDEEYGGSTDSDSDGEEVEDGEVAEAKVPRSGDRGKSTKRRSYWLSKAMDLSAADSN